jgi:hypothetical protein
VTAKILFLWWITFLGTTPIFAQADSLGVASVRQKIGYLTLTSRRGGVHAYLDSTEIGSTPLTKYAVSSGHHTLLLSAGPGFRWGSSLAKDTIEVEEGRELVLVRDVTNPVRIVTVPAGVAVFRGAAELGHTPLEIDFDVSGPDTIELREQGYFSFVLHPDSLLASPGILRLTPLSGVKALAERDVTSDRISPLDSQTWLTVGAGAAMLVSGIAAAYLKDQANKEFDAYVATGNSENLSRTHRLDDYSGAAMLVTEISFGVLASSLLFE